MTVLEQISHLADLPVTVDIELDRRVMTMREVLEVGAGSVIGEIVIIEDTVGIRITDFTSEE